MRALFLNATLKKSPEESNTGALAAYVGTQLEALGVETEHVRLADLRIEPGVVSEAVEDGDQWPEVHAKLLEADILVLATPTWLGQPSSIVKKALERMDAMLSETDDEERPVAWNRVCGFIVVGNEDGAHHCIAEMAGAVNDIGYTCPGQGWTYWNKGPGPGEEEYTTSDEQQWTHETGDTMAHLLFHTARALQENPIPQQ